MPRSVNSVASRARRKKILKRTRGNRPSQTARLTRSVSQFMGKLNAQNIGLNRKVLADLAMNNPQAFEAIINSVK